MAEVKNYKRSAYVPFTDDPNVRKRIMQTLDRSRHIPEKFDLTYPNRGTQIELKVRCLNQDNPNKEIIREESPLKDIEVIDDTLCVLAVFGNDPKRIEAQKKAIDLLRKMSPLPRIVLVEGSTDGNGTSTILKANQV